MLLGKKVYNKKQCVTFMLTNLGLVLMVCAVESMAMSQPVLGYVNSWTRSMWPELPIVQTILNNLKK